MKINLYQAIIILIAAVAVLSGIQALISTINPDTVPSNLQFIYYGLAYVFLSGTGTVLFTFLRNIMGYAENKLNADPSVRSQIQYEAGMLGATAAKYATFIYGFTAAIQAVTMGTPYYAYATYIAGAIGLVVDMFVGALKKQAAVQSPSVAQATIISKP
jgi:hypothetical protein